MESVCNKEVHVPATDAAGLALSGPEANPFTSALAEVPPKASLDAAGELLRALAAPVRIAIILQLHKSSRCVHELVGALDVPQPLISQHLRVLKSAGVVRGKRTGREVLYELVDDHLARIVLDALAHAQEQVSDATAQQ
ncbi:MAG: winged helix-turn-helix transcriptional regulator [Aldersonia sp.]|nr:winged helix-turn-helix transcriptional regulator [Aldersonia sp.]